MMDKRFRLFCLPRYHMPTLSVLFSSFASYFAALNELAKTRLTFFTRPRARACTFVVRACTCTFVGLQRQGTAAFLLLRKTHLRTRLCPAKRAYRALGSIGVPDDLDLSSANHPHRLWTPGLAFVMLHVTSPFSLTTRRRSTSTSNSVPSKKNAFKRYFSTEDSNDPVSKDPFRYTHSALMPAIIALITAFRCANQPPLITANPVSGTRASANR
jgi:hypothetical protein